MGKIRIIAHSDRPFRDRVEAAGLLANELKRYGGQDTVVLGIPPGKRTQKDLGGRKMRKMAFILAVIFLALTCQCAENKGGTKKMEISSPEFKNNEMMPERFGYDKDNVNPELEIDGVPPEAKSLVLIVDDPDAPLRPWVHWVLYDMPVIDRIEEDSAPGTQGITDYKQKRYGGPFPPSGTHRYFFKLYAIDKKLGLKEGADKKAVERAMEGHILEEAELVGLYKK